MPLTGKNYYRIKAVDKDGKVAYSNTVSLNITNTGREILVYPNPVYRGGTLTITARSLKAGSYTINITSAEGKTICSYRTDHNGGNFFGRYMIPGNAAQGTYFVTVAGETIAVKEKIIVQ